MNDLMHIEHGYILVAKKLQDSKIYHMPRVYREVWMHLIMNARFKDQQINKQGNLLKRGQLYTTYDQIAESLYWFENKKKYKYTHRQIKSALKTFREEKMITTERHPRGVTITISNYRDYQNSQNYKKRTLSNGNMKKVNNFNKFQTQKTEPCPTNADLCLTDSLVIT